MAKHPLYILATPRSGTTLLQVLLNQTGLFDPKISEWFNPRPYYDHIPWPMDEKLPRNCKVFPQHLKQRFGSARLEPIEEAWPDVKYVVVYRKDVAAQTASWMYSCRSDTWNTGDDKRIACYSEQRFDIGQKEAMDVLYWMHNESQKITELFKGKEFVRLEYNQITDDPVGVVQQILRWCNYEEVDPAVFDFSTATKKLPNPGKDELAGKIRQWQKELTDARLPLASP